MVLNFHSFNFNFRNKKKSVGATSGEYTWWVSSVTLFVAKNAFMISQGMWHTSYKPSVYPNLQ